MFSVVTSSVFHFVFEDPKLVFFFAFARPLVSKVNLSFLGLIIEGVPVFLKVNSLVDAFIYI